MADGFALRQVQAAGGALHHPGRCGVSPRIVPGREFFQTPERQNGDGDEDQDKQ
jgi:hypothetical protein